MSASPYRSPSPLARTDEKYARDDAFRVVVDVLSGAIDRLDLTPGEVREAAVYACMRVEMRRASNYLVPLDPQIAAAVMPSNPDGEKSNA
jgi:hypothetical protein